MPRDPRRRIRLPSATVMLAAVAAVACSADGDDTTSNRQEEVAERGAQVMPFDLDATTHRFEPAPAGLIETVVADDPADGQQVALVQQHLAEEAERFRAGDYGDPAAIHGHEMPGLAELEAAAGAVTIELTNLANGATLTFTTTRPNLVDALHRWGEAQTFDHGDHTDLPTGSPPPTTRRVGPHTSDVQGRL